MQHFIYNMKWQADKYEMLKLEVKISLTHDRKHAGNLIWETSFYSDWYMLSLYI